MRRDYQEPITKVVYLQGRQSLLGASVGSSGVNAKMQGYSANDDDDYGFNQPD